jgi:hypothetical protein
MRKQQSVRPAAPRRMSAKWINSSLLSGIFNGCNGSDSSQSIALALRTLTWLIAPCITPGGCRCPGHTGPCRIDLLCVLQRHPRRFPPTSLSDRRQVNVESCEILSRPHPRRMPANSMYNPLRHANPLRHPFEDRRNAPGIQRSTDLSLPDEG